MTEANQKPFKSGAFGGKRSDARRDAAKEQRAQTEERAKPARKN
jgi:hypothetical protein